MNIIDALQKLRDDLKEWFTNNIVALNTKVNAKVSVTEQDLSEEQKEQARKNIGIVGTPPDWAKQPEKPKYTADEVGALPKDTKIPAKTSDISNDSGFITRTVGDLANYYLKSETLTKTEINALVSAIPKFAIQVVNSLPTTDISTTTVYLLKSGIESDLYTEYIYVNGNWEILGSQRVDLTGYATENWVNIQLSAYLKSNELASAINAALAQAKASGEFNGEDGERGTSILRVTTAPSAYTTATGGFTPAYRIALSTVKTQASVDEVRVGDTILRNYYTYKVGYVDASYAYLTTYASIRGSAGTSVTISSTTESEADGGENVVAFSDGKTLTVKNGRKGSDGKTPHIGENGNWYIGETDTGAKAVGGDEIYVGDGEMPDDATIQIILDGSDEEQALRDELKEYIDEELASELAKRGQLKPEFAQSKEWLDANGDQSKMYVLPDGFIYAWMLTEKEVEGGPAYTNKLPLATDTDRSTIYGSDYDGDGDNDGYLKGKRLSSSGSEADLATSSVSGFIPASVGDVLRIKNTKPINASTANYTITYDSTNAKVGYQTMPKISDTTDWSQTTKDWWTYDGETITITLSPDFFGTGFNAVRFSAGTINADTIVTVDEEIKEGGTTTVTEYAWANTGHAFVPADYEDRIIKLENETAKNTVDIEKLKAGVFDIDDPLAYIRQWDAPIYDKTPVYELTSEKAALTSADKTVAAVYAKYDALMAANPDFITKTDLGLCSDGVTHVYRYDFKEREPRHQSGFQWSETKPKFIVVTGIHREWNGIYGMFHALSEIATNSELAELRRSVHFIVVPVLNPYSISGAYATVGHAANANGVEIHRNFEVGFSVSGEGTIHYTGETALSEVESQYLDNILKNNKDAAYFLTCHSFDRDKTWGVGFLWGSSATKYMCNMAFRVIDKMGKAWHKKYGTAWEEGIKAQNEYLLANTATFPNAKALEDGDYRIGHAALTNTGGCEQRQATKYGIQATNFEVGETFFVLDETSLSAKAITHGAEAYVNFFLTAMGVYDPKDKKEYATN